MMLIDAIVVPFALWVAVVLRYGELYKDLSSFWWLFALSSIICIPAFHKFGLYRAIVRYIGPSSMLPVMQGVTITTIGVFLAAYLTPSTGFPRSAPIIFWFISLLLVGGSRLAVRAYFYGLFNNYLTRENVAIYGAGASGAQLAIALLNDTTYMPVAFIDDNRSLRRSTIHGISVYSSRKIERLVEQLSISQILLAMPSATHAQRQKVLLRLADLPVHIRTVPDFKDIISGEAEVSEIREVDIEDLLGRDAVPPDPELLAANIKDKNVLVTGAGGSIGSELCRIIMTQQPAKLILLDSSEYALYEIERELRKLAKKAEFDINIVALLGNIQDRNYTLQVMMNLSVQSLYHAAAYKHVPLVEQNIIEGIKNNVLGTYSVVQAAIEAAVESFVFISSDKAVRCTNVMGATKRLSELIIQATAAESDQTRFCMVRFGNVLASSGSVVPLFHEQIETGGPVTVTHAEATRFFMTISEAAELVVQAGAMTTLNAPSAGEQLDADLYVLDMGEAVSINELAEKMIQLSGYTVQTDAGGDIAIEYTGLRQGEKLHEELLIGNEVTGTSHPKIMKAREDYLPRTEMLTLLDRIQQACDNFDYKALEAVIVEGVVGFEAIDGQSDALQHAVNDTPSSPILVFPTKQRD